MDPSCRVCCGAPSGASGASPTSPAAGSSSIIAGTSRRTSTRPSAGGPAGTTVARAGPFTVWFTVFCRGASCISRSGVCLLGDVRTTGDPAGSVDGRRKPTGVLGVTPTPTVIDGAITRRSFYARPRRVTRTPFSSSAPGAGDGPTITRRLTPSATFLSPVAVRRHARVSSARGKWPRSFLRPGFNSGTNHRAGHQPSNLRSTRPGRRRNGPARRNRR